MTRSDSNDARAYLADAHDKYFAPDAVAIVVTHLLPDRLDFLPELASVLEIGKVLAIPYSLDRCTANLLSAKYDIAEPNLEDLRSTDYLRSILSKFPKRRKIILDIGGYFSFLQRDDVESALSEILGIVEDTEAGHRA